MNFEATNLHISKSRTKTEVYNNWVKDFFWFSKQLSLYITAQEIVTLVDLDKIDRSVNWLSRRFPQLLCIHTKLLQNPEFLSCLRKNHGYSKINPFSFIIEIFLCLICTLNKIWRVPCKIYPIFFRVAKAPEIF